MTQQVVLVPGRPASRAASAGSSTRAAAAGRPSSSPGCRWTDPTPNACGGFGGQALEAAEPAAAPRPALNHPHRRHPGHHPVLPAIAEGVGGQVEVLLDGGIRRGGDVVKAVALGAKAVMIGRAYLWGPAANGQAGVENVLDILRGGMDSALLGLGKASIADLTPDDLVIPPGFTRTLGGDDHVVERSTGRPQARTLSAGRDVDQPRELVMRERHTNKSRLRAWHAVAAVAVAAALALDYGAGNTAANVRPPARSMAASGSITWSPWQRADDRAAIRSHRPSGAAPLTWRTWPVTKEEASGEAR
jgi:hypothetical protein